MESRFEITESPDALAAVLASSQRRTHRGYSIERAFCAGCAWKTAMAANTNLIWIGWWLEQQTAKAF